MDNRTTVVAQFLKLISTPEFKKLADEHHQGQKFRRFTHFDQFDLLLSLQVTGRTSIRDVVNHAITQTSKFVLIKKAAIMPQVGQFLFCRYWVSFTTLPVTRRTTSMHLFRRSRTSVSPGFHPHSTRRRNADPVGLSTPTKFVPILPT